MNCIETLVGLRGGCSDVSAVGDVSLDDKVSYSELQAFISQKDHASVDAMFTRWREQAVREVVDSVNEAFAGSYIRKTVVDSKLIGQTGDRLSAVAAAPVTRGLRFYRCHEWPSVAYRLTRVGLLSQVTGNVTVQYFDGITGQVLGSDVIAAVAGQNVTLSVNRLFRGVRILHIGYNATAVAAYTTNVCPSLCYTCPNVLSNMRTSNDSAGLSVVMALECDSEAWMCSIRQNFAMPMLWKVAELAMEYAIFNTNRNNTKTVRDHEMLKERQMMYRENFTRSLGQAVKTVNLPDDPICFKCNRRSRIAVAIP
jgi:hypothetical protein